MILCDFVWISNVGKRSVLGIGWTNQIEAAQSCLFPAGISNGPQFSIIPLGFPKSSLDRPSPAVRRRSPFPQASPRPEALPCAEEQPTKRRLSFSTNSSVTRHTQFFRAPDLVFSRIFRISEIFEKKNLVTCLKSWSERYSTYPKAT